MRAFAFSPGVVLVFALVHSAHALLAPPVLAGRVLKVSHCTSLGHGRNKAPAARPVLMVQEQATPWVEPATHNKKPVIVAAVLAATSLAARGSVLVPGNLSKFLHLLAFGVWTGTTIWTTFVSGITMLRNLPRQTFGKIQAKLFPKYFQLNTAAVLALLVTLPSTLRSSMGAVLGLSLACVLANLWFFEPSSTEIMLQRHVYCIGICVKYELENKGEKDSDAYGDLAKAFGKFHGLSSLANLGALIGCFVYAWKLALTLAF